MSAPEDVTPDDGEIDAPDLLAKLTAARIQGRHAKVLELFWRLRAWLISEASHALLPVAVAARTAAGSLGDTAAEIEALHLIGICEMQRGRLAEARSALQEVLRLAHAECDVAAEARAFAVLGQCAARDGDELDGMRLLEAALERYEAIDDVRGRAQAHGDLGNRADRIGDLSTALEHYAAAARLFVEQGAWSDLGHVARDAAISLNRSAPEEGLMHALLGVVARQEAGDAVGADGSMWEAATWATESRVSRVTLGIASRWYPSDLVTRASRLVDDLRFRASVCALLSSSPELRSALTDTDPSAASMEAEALLRSSADLHESAGATAIALGYHEAADEVARIRTLGAVAAAEARDAAIEALTLASQLESSHAFDLMDAIANAEPDEANGLIASWRGDQSHDEVVLAVLEGTWAQTRLARAEEAADPVAEVEEAIIVLGRSVQALGPDRGAIFWLGFIRDLGSAYRHRSGDAALDHDAAIHYLERPLTAGIPLTSATAPLLAACQANLANTLLFRPNGDPSENVERAIGLYESEVLPFFEGTDRVKALINLGLAYSLRRADDPLKNEIIAFQYLQQAAGTVSDREEPILAAHALHNLGLLYRRRVGGDPVANLEHAIETYRAAVGLFEAGGYMFQAANSRAALATALAERTTGDATYNIRQAYSELRRAIDQLERGGRKADLAGAHNNAGTMLLDLAERTGDPDVFAQATEHLGRALHLRPREEMPLEWSQVQHNLGNLHVALANRTGEDLDGYERAARYYRQALEVRSAETHPELWAESAQGLAFALRASSAEDPAGLDVEKLYKDVIELRRRAGAVRDVIEPLEALAQIFMERGDASGALQFYEDAVDAVEQVYASAVRPTSQLRVLDQFRGLFASAIEAALRAGAPLAAALLCERSRARLLGEARERDSTHLHRVAEVAPDLCRAYEEVASKLRRHNKLAPSDVRSYEEVGAPDLASWGDAEEMWSALHQLTTQIRTLPECVDFMRPFDPDGLEAVVSTRGMVLYVLPIREALAFIACVSSAEGLRVDAYTSTSEAATAVYQHVFGGADGGNESFLAQQFLGATFDPDFESLCAALGTAIPEQLWARLASEAERVNIVAFGPLSLVPWHAAIDESSARLIDLSVIAYTPSARVLAQLGAGSLPNTVRGVVVGDPRADLRGAREEASVVARCLDEATLLIGAEATRGAVVEALPTASVFHFAGHASYNPDRPLESGLQMSDRLLTLDDLGEMNRLREIELVVLSACQSGVTDILAPAEESIGLATGFLFAGAGTVVASLWPVDDRATRALMEHFYNGLSRRLPPAEALTEAQRVLATGGAPVDYWAAFVCIGA